MSDHHPAARLGRLLTGTEAGKLAARFEDGATLSQALQGIAGSRRADVRAALDAARVTPANLAVAVPVLRAIQGANSRSTQVSPVWTLPGHLADYGGLTSSVKDLVTSARVSVTCSTFNFQKSSALWDALAEVAGRGTVDVRVYMDADAADNPSLVSTPTSTQVAAQLAGARVFRTRKFNDKQVRNHAKFVAVDHQFLIVTSANFSWSAEQNNVELGLRVDSRPLTEMVEQQLLDAEASVYELVSP